MSETLLKVVVRKRESHTDGVIALELESLDGEMLPAFQAGAHIDLHLGEELIRQYSLCGDPADTSVYRLGILKDPNSRGGSVAAHLNLLEGTELTISMPRNHFPLMVGAKRSILIGGGIGITPMMSMAYSLMADNQPFELHYCGRSRETSGFLNDLASCSFTKHVDMHFDSEDQRLDLEAALKGADADTHLYVCGPNGFMDWVIGSAKELGVPDTNVHKEFFNVEVKTGGASFEVFAEKSGITVQVGENESIADALKAAGVKVQVSCEQGTCGTCLCDVIEGIPEHRDVYLTDEEKEDNDQITVCCSRSLSPRLVLDI
ncbi:Vanillate O-demethylase oxidoreductase [Marinomonas primoryensis]|uniref:Vanillate O-demethylase oxidoreductase n=1 Tax=Marinomonas primoryensis TaxID=178399 RepID=A0A2Z4PVF5_9GAMM|nr:PDR/VanB family oxidoreductase [Marinomonas primoryensis]AWY01598.1 Vanillate O-demethylase oxidoreductase [Marinomonas primoryensis]